jgi:hypothetical protein
MGRTRAAAVRVVNQASPLRAEAPPAPASIAATTSATSARGVQIVLCLIAFLPSDSPDRHTIGNFRSEHEIRTTLGRVCPRDCRDLGDAENRETLSQVWDSLAGELTT